MDKSFNEPWKGFFQETEKQAIDFVEFVRVREEMEAPVQQEIIIMKTQGTPRAQNIAHQDFQFHSNSWCTQAVRNNGFCL